MRGVTCVSWSCNIHVKLSHHTGPRRKYVLNNNYFLLLLLTQMVEHMLPSLHWRSGIQTRFWDYLTSHRKTVAFPDRDIHFPLQISLTGRWHLPSQQEKLHCHGTKWDSPSFVDIMCHFKAKDLGNKASAPESMGLAAHAVTLSILAQQMLSNWAALHSSMADSHSF